VDYFVAGLLGLITGSILYGLTYSSVFPALSQVAYFGSITLPQAWNMSPALLIAVVAVFMFILFYFLERGLKRPDKLEEPPKSGDM
jgi:hypothetical protein